MVPSPRARTLKVESIRVSQITHMSSLRGRYLTHIKGLLKQWPHLQLLADFMDVGTTPVRWNASVPGGYPAENKLRRESNFVAIQS